MPVLTKSSEELLYILSTGQAKGTLQLHPKLDPDQSLDLIKVMRLKPRPTDLFYLLSKGKSEPALVSMISCGTSVHILNIMSNVNQKTVRRDRTVLLTTKKKSETNPAICR